MTHIPPVQVGRRTLDAHSQPTPLMIRHIGELLTTPSLVNGYIQRQIRYGVGRYEFEQRIAESRDYGLSYRNFDNRAHSTIDAQQFSKTEHLSSRCKSQSLIDRDHAGIWKVIAKDSTLGIRHP